MDGIVERETAERDAGGCGCSGGATLDVLKEVQRVYEQRMELLNSSSGTNKLQKQVQLLQSWVSDLVGQNALLARTVEELEAEVVSRLLLERRRHAERDKSNAYDILNETKKLNEALQNEISTKEREIRRLKKETQQHEQTIMSLRKEVSLDREVSKANAEVTADICCPGMQIGDVTPVKDFSSQLRRETAKYHERLTEMEDSVKSSAEKVRALREANVALSTEVASLQQVACALAEQCRAHVVRAAFLEDVVCEMRRQLRHAKTKLKEASKAIGSRVCKETASNLGMGRHSVSCDSIASACVLQQPRRSHTRHLLELEPYACGMPFGGSGGDSARPE